MIETWGRGWKLCHLLSPHPLTSDLKRTYSTETNLQSHGWGLWWGGRWWHKEHPAPRRRPWSGRGHMEAGWQRPERGEYSSQTTPSHRLLCKESLSCPPSTPSLRVFKVSLGILLMSQSHYCKERSRHIFSTYKVIRRKYLVAPQYLTQWQCINISNV